MAEGGEAVDRGEHEEANEVQESELVSFEQADEFKALLFSGTFFGGSLDRFKDGSEQHVEQSVQLLASESSSKEPVGASETLADDHLRRMTGILDVYQDQSYLLDPYLELMVSAPVHALRAIVKGEIDARRDDRDRLAKLLYHYTKVRGYKTITHFFPHDVGDLLPTIEALEMSIARSDSTIWETRFVLLLWLSLICMIPFDFQQFDALSDINTTIAKVERIGRHYLSSPGKERDGAANLLSKLFLRRDAGGQYLDSFLKWSQAMLTTSAKPTAFLITGIMQTLCRIVKILTPSALESHLQTIRAILDTVLNGGDGTGALQKAVVDNGVINKFKSKMACRLGLKLLPPPKAILQAPRSFEATGIDSLQATEADFDVPEEIDSYIAILLDFLKDKDTIVRYSAAKGIARIASRLPDSFVEQIADEITSMFAIGVGDFMGKAQDLSGVSEYTWQGCCLALAELARRGLLKEKEISEKLVWIEKALLFDVKRGAHSVGTGVRDAACYVLWALARSHDKDALQPHGISLSQKLVCVTLFDRDISIRRAASAAFQECVGRLGIFPRGIDVIRETDFYAVSVRRNAFIYCAPKVAQHAEYRFALVDHLIDTSLEHWDEVMRDLAAESLARIAQSDLIDLGRVLVDRLVAKINTRDQFTLHGVLRALAEICKLCKQHLEAEVAFQCRFSAFQALSELKKPAPRQSTTNMILRSTCDLIAESVSSSQRVEGAQVDSSAIIFIDMALTRQDERCHEAAANAIAAWSLSQDFSDRIDSIVKHWRTFDVAQQQGNALILGTYQYKVSPAKLETAVHFLLSIVKEKSALRSAHVETRRNAMTSLASVIVRLQDAWRTLLPSPLLFQILEALLSGLEDYSTDARGDVGSWVRVASMRGIEQVVRCVTTFPPELNSHEAERMQEIGDRMLAGLARQMLERIESVKLTAKLSFSKVLQLYADLREAGKTQSVATSASSLLGIFAGAQLSDVADAKLYELIVRILGILDLRFEILKGIVIGIGSQRESLNHDLAACLSRYVTSAAEYNISQLTNDLQDLIKANVRSNRFFVPCLQTYNVLIELSAFDDQTVTQKELRSILQVSTRSVDKVKSVPRILAAAQFVANLLRFSALRNEVADHLSDFLLHPYPTVRSSFAEMLYVQWQGCMDDIPEEAEDLLLSTPWASDGTNLVEPATQLRSLLLSTV